MRRGEGARLDDRVGALLHVVLPHLLVRLADGLVVGLDDKLGREDVGQFRAKPVAAARDLRAYGLLSKRRSRFSNNRKTRRTFFWSSS